MQMAKNNEAVLCIQEVLSIFTYKKYAKKRWTRLLGQAVAGNEAGNLLYSAHTEDIL